jgi:hypothetical protein
MHTHKFRNLLELFDEEIVYEDVGRPERGINEQRRGEERRQGWEVGYDM